MRLSIVILAGMTMAALPSRGQFFDESSLTPAERQEHRERLARKAKRIAERGGYAFLAPTGKVVRVISAQGLVGKKDLDESINVFSSTLRLPVEWRDAEGLNSPAKIAEASNGDGRTGAAVILVEDADQETLLIAPEGGWACVNVLKLAADKPTREQLVRRVKQEFWRATCMLLGAYASNQQPCLLTLVTSNADLDRNACVIPSIEVLPKVKSAGRALGIIPGRRAVYEKACQEGWAPAPTNDIQKAIWDKVHTIPSAPIRIKPEAKKVRE